MPGRPDNSLAMLRENLFPGEGSVYPESIQNTPSEDIFIDLNSLFSDQARLSQEEQKSRLFSIYQQANQRLEQILRESEVKKKDMGILPSEDSEYVGPDYEVLHLEPNPEELNFLRTIVNSINPLEIGVARSLDRLKAEFLPTLPRVKNEVKNDLEINKVISQILNAFESQDLFHQQQLESLNLVLAEVNRGLSSFQNQLNQLTIEQNRALQINGSPDVDLQNQINLVNEKIKFLNRIRSYIEHNEIDGLVNYLHGLALLENDRRDDEKKADEKEKRSREFQERIKNNEAIQFLLSQGFEPEKLLLDTSELQGSEREKAIEEKYRYIESAVFSIFLKEVVSLTKPETLKMDDLLSIELTPTASSGSRVSFSINLKRLIMQIQTSIPAVEQARADKAEKHLMHWVSTLNKWSGIFNRLREIGGDRSKLGSVYQSEDDFFDPNLLIRDSGPTPLSTIPPLQIPVVTGNGIEWKEIYKNSFYDSENGEQNDHAMIDLIGRVMFIFMASNRYAPGFNANTFVVDLNTSLLGPNMSTDQINKTPYMWRVNKDRELFKPLVYVTPNFSNADLSEDHPLYRQKTLPRTRFAKNDTLNRSGFHRTQLLNEHFNPPEIKIGNDGSLLYHDEETGQDYPVQYPTQVALPYFVEQLMEGSFFSALGDNGYLLTGDDIASNLIPQWRGSIEGKHAEQRFNPQIAIKYMKGGSGREEVAQHGSYNLASLAVVGPQPYPTLMEYGLFSGINPETGRFEIGTFRDWVVWLRGKISRFPWDQMAPDFTSRFANDSTYIFRILNFIHEEKGQINHLLEVDQEHGFIEVVHDEVVQGLVNLERWIKVYVLGSLEARRITTTPFISTLLDWNNMPAEVSRPMRILFSDVEVEYLSQILTSEEIKTQETDDQKRSWIVKKLSSYAGDDNEYKKSLERRFNAWQDDFGSRADHFCQVIVRNTDTGEVITYYTSAHKHFQFQPGAILSQCDDYQLLDLRSSDNPNGKHYAEWVSSDSDGWMEVANFLSGPDSRYQNGLTPEENRLYYSYIEETRKDSNAHPVPTLLISVGGQRKLDQRTAKYIESSSSETPEPIDLLSDKIFFDSIGAANSMSNIFEELTSVQVLAILVAFSEQSRLRFINKYYERLGGMAINDIKRKALDFLTKNTPLPKSMSESLKNELPPSMALPNKGSSAKILMFLFGRNNATTTFEELMKDEKTVNEVLKLFRLDFD